MLHGLITRVTNLASHRNEKLASQACTWIDQIFQSGAFNCSCSNWRLASAWPHSGSSTKGEDAMKGDLFVMTAGMLAVGAVTWAFWGNPVNAPRPHSRA